MSRNWERQQKKNWLQITPNMKNSWKLDKMLSRMWDEKWEFNMTPYKFDYVKEAFESLLHLFYL